MNLRFDEVVFERTGQLKLVTLVIGVIDLGLIAASYIHTDTREQAFLAAVIICFILSLINVLGSITGVFRPSSSDSIQNIDLLYHVIACVFLLCCDIALFVTLIKYGTKRVKFGTRLMAWIFGVLNTAVYGFIPWRIWRQGGGGQT